MKNRDVYFDILCALVVMFGIAMGYVVFHFVAKYW